jgi:hypothetical protein
LCHSRTQGSKLYQRKEEEEEEVEEESRKKGSRRNQKVLLMYKTGHLAQDCPTKKANTVF